MSMNKIENFIWDNGEIDYKFSNQVEESPYFKMNEFLKENKVSLDELIELSQKCNKFDDFEIKKNSSIAVVGNSGILMENEFGKEIDEHDIIIRCNRARTIGFEKHVGGKTTLRMVATKSAGAYDLSETFSDWDPEFLANLKNEHLILCGPRINQLLVGFFSNRKV